MRSYSTDWATKTAPSSDRSELKEGYIIEEVTSLIILRTGKRKRPRFSKIYENVASEAVCLAKYVKTEVVRPLCLN